MAQRSIRDWIRRKSRGRKAMTSDMRNLIDSNSFEAQEPERPRTEQDAVRHDSAPEATDASDQPSQAAQSA